MSAVEVLSPGALFGTMRQSANGAGRVRPLCRPRSLKNPGLVRECVLMHMCGEALFNEHRCCVSPWGGTALVSTPQQPKKPNEQ